MAREIDDKDLCSVLLLCSDFTPRTNNKYGGLRHVFEVWVRAHLETPSYLTVPSRFPPRSREST
eukprot:scaffold13789_cov143-Skeletonema_dohrnii-CCMP3373.AAC.2